MSGSLTTTTPTIVMKPLTISGDTAVLKFSIPEDWNAKNPEGTDLFTKEDKIHAIKDAVRFDNPFSKTHLGDHGEDAGCLLVHILGNKLEDLVANPFDAGATEVTINLHTDDGEAIDSKLSNITSCVITDNGSGFLAKDHATPVYPKNGSLHKFSESALNTFFIKEEHGPKVGGARKGLRTLLSFTQLDKTGKAGLSVGNGEIGAIVEIHTSKCPMSSRDFDLAINRDAQKAAEAESLFSKDEISFGYFGNSSAFLSDLSSSTTPSSLKDSSEGSPEAAAGGTSPTRPLALTFAGFTAPGANKGKKEGGLAARRGLKGGLSL